MFRCPPQQTRDSCGSSAGFTLIEMMISVVLTAVVAGAGFQLFVVAGSQEGTQRMLTDVQQSALFAMDILARDIQGAGVGVSSGVVRTDTGGTIRDFPIVCGGGAAAATDTLVIVKTKAPLMDVATPGMDFWLDPANRPGAYLANPVTPFTLAGGSLTVDDSVGFNDGDLVLLTDFRQAKLMRILGMPGLGALPIQPPSQADLPAGLAAYRRGSAILRVQVIRYRILQDAAFATNGRVHLVREQIDPTAIGLLIPPVGPGAFVPALRSQIVGQDIENFQVQFLIDLDSDGTANPATVGELVDSIAENADSFSPTPPQTIRGVVVGVTARTRKADPNFKKSEIPALLLSPASSVNDGYRRRSMTATSSIRNLALKWM